MGLQERMVLDAIALKLGPNGERWVQGENITEFYSYGDEEPVIRHCLFGALGDFAGAELYESHDGEYNGDQVIAGELDLEGPELRVRDLLTEAALQLFGNKVLFGALYGKPTVLDRPFNGATTVQNWQDQNGIGGQAKTTWPEVKAVLNRAKELAARS